MCAFLSAVAAVGPAPGLVGCGEGGSPSGARALRDVVTGRGRRPLLLVFAALALASALPGCEPEAHPAAAGDGPYAISRSALRVCAAGVTTPGVDVSKWQGAIDWPRVADAGITFAITRVGHGTYFDPYFDENWAAIRANGMVRGAYLFYEPLEGVAEQAALVVDAIGELGPGDLPVTLDVEWTDGTPTLADLRLLSDLIEEGTGKRPMVYTSTSYWNQYFTDELGAHDLWAANWDVSCPSVPEGWSDWLFWQTSGGGGDVPGISGGVDEDVFNGSRADLAFVADLPAHGTCSGSSALRCHRDGCGCVLDACSGGACPGSGCTEAEDAACAAQGAQCQMGSCVGAGACAGVAVLPADVCWEGRRFHCDDGGGATVVPPLTETCDGRDEDCDGATDEDFGLGAPCSAGAGACAFTGVLACASDGSGRVVCSATEPLCDDGNPCTTNGCDPVTGCTFTPNTVPCDDGDRCTVGDRCAGGSCAPGALAPGCCGDAADCPEGERCSAEGRCEAEPCAPRERTACVDGAVVWIDGCGRAGDRAEDCGDRGCVGVACCADGTHVQRGACVRDRAPVDAADVRDGTVDSSTGGGGGADLDAGWAGDPGSGGSGCRAGSTGADPSGIALLLFVAWLTFRAARLPSRATGAERSRRANTRV